MACPVLLSHNNRSFSIFDPPRKTLVLGHWVTVGAHRQGPSDGDEAGSRSWRYDNWNGSACPRIQSVRDPPWRSCSPSLKRINGPGVGFAFVARRAGVGNASLLSLNRADKSKRVSGDEVVFDGLLDEGHVTGNALASRTVLPVMSVLAYFTVEAGRILLVVAEKADCIALSNQI